ncbi:Phenolic glucoside malonyltransferase [Quillaja saponaria]|uniref:Phenolic glucoside malonyltransferase n=1 Tax=Quillaja saponaria TaxID=32244 RepID=A0AAD7PXM7_QUISA|nr:Phenolic glucoside malonyltransferase [Quillaja saponaria]
MAPLNKSSVKTLEFLPLNGKITWPPQSHKPFIQYTPGDGVSLIIAQSEAEFDHLSGNLARETIASHPLVPHLDTSQSHASIISLQVTLFPNAGFCIGLTAHHAVLDGKSSTMFMKAWAYICRTFGKEEFGFSFLPPELKPSFDRSLIKDPNRLDMVYLNQFTALGANSEPKQYKERSLRILSNTWRQSKSPDSVRATFQLNRADIDKLKKRVLTQWDAINQEGEKKIEKPVNLSTFVATCAYVLVCMNEVFKDKDIVFGFIADCRARLDPPVDPSYFGNCVFPYIVDTEPGDFTDLVNVAKKIFNQVKKLEKGAAVLDGAEGLPSKWASLSSSSSKRVIGVSGSNRFRVYETDFGWGKPIKVETTTTSGTIGMAESRDGNGGIEIGLVFSKDEMDLFASLFHSGLEALP